MTEPELVYQERLRTRLDAMIIQAMRAHEPAIEAAALEAEECGLADGHTTTFLRASRRLLLATAASLSTTAELHRLRRVPQATTAACMSCGTEGRCRTIGRIADTLAMYHPGPVAAGRAEALLRADGHFNPSGADQHLLGIQEIPDGYVTWAVPSRYAGTDGPSTRSAVVIVDKQTGMLTQWPALAIETLSEHYRRYVLGLPLTHEGDSHGV